MPDSPSTGGLSPQGTVPTTRRTLRDVAEAAGVSLSTASRVSRGAASVRPEVRARVLDAIERLGYQPDRAARSIRTGRSGVVGYVVADVANPFFAAIVKGASAVLEPEGHALLLASSGYDPVVEERALRSLRAHRVDGLVLSVTDEQAPYLAAHVARVPSVAVDRLLAGAVDVVRSDHAIGIGDAVRHLARLGHRRLVLLAGSDRQLGTRARIEAFRDAAAACGLAERETLVRSACPSGLAGRALAAEVLATAPTALLVASYDLLVAMLEELAARGLRIPDDVSFVACDDLDVCRIATPPLDVVRRDIELLGREAATLLLRRLRGEVAGGPQASVLPTEFLARASSAPPSDIRVIPPTSR
jgi:LacI family transcriptional regulator